jgi:carboxyl-terminal processing protease
MILRRRWRTSVLEALDWIEERCIFVTRAEWPELRRRALALEDDRILAFLLRELRDRHGFVLDPKATQRFRARWSAGLAYGLGMVAVHPECVVIDVTPGGPAERAGVLLGDRVESVDGKRPVELPGKGVIDLTHRRRVHLAFSRRGTGRAIDLVIEPVEHSARSWPSGFALEGGTAYLNLPKVGIADADTYVAAAHDVIRALDEAAPRGWIVDLRRNMGGNPYALLVAAGPILGDGRIGGLIDRHRTLSAWVYRDGQVFAGPIRRNGVAGPYTLRRHDTAVAVLTSKLTASAGEALTVAFRGRPRACSVGEATFGTPTGLDAKILRDGRLLAVSVAAYADRNGNAYRAPVVPDERVDLDWSSPIFDDRAVKAARAWLATSS